MIQMLYWLQTFQAQGSFLLLEILEDMFIYGLPQTMPLLICTLFQQRYGLRSTTSSILHYGDVAVNLEVNWKTIADSMQMTMSFSCGDKNLLDRKTKDSLHFICVSEHSYSPPSFFLDAHSTRIASLLRAIKNHQVFCTISLHLKFPIFRALVIHGAGWIQKTLNVYELQFF